LLQHTTTTTTTTQQQQQQHNNDDVCFKKRVQKRREENAAQNVKELFLHYKANAGIYIWVHFREKVVTLKKDQ